MKRLLTLIFALAALAAAAQKWEPVHHRFDSLALCRERSRNHYELRPEDYAQVAELRRIADASSDRRLKWRALYWEALLSNYEDRNDLCRAKIAKALTMVDSVRYPYDYHRIKWVEMLSNETHDMVAIYRFSRNELKYYESIGDTLMMGIMNLNLSRAYRAFGRSEKALEFDKKSRELYHAIGYDDALVMQQNDLMNTYMEAGDTATARRMYHDMLANPLIQADTLLLIGVLTNGYVNRLDSTSIIKAYELSRLRPGTAEYYNVPLNYGSYHYVRGNYRRALELYTESAGYDRDYSEAYDGIRLASLGGRMYCYEKLGMLDSAYYFASLYYEYADSLNRLNSLARFQRLYEQEVMEREEELMATERQEARSRLLVVVLAFTAAVLALGWAVVWHRYRRRLKEAENRSLTAQVENERLERRLVEERCEGRERELTTNSLLLIEKRRMIDHLNRRIEETSDEGRIDSATRRELQTFIRSHQGTEESLAQFYDYFNQVHPDFFKRLKELCPELTRGDLRICAYLRMGLDSKQIAQIMSVQPDAIKKARYRLRKKLGLPAGADLEEYLATK